MSTTHSDYFRQGRHRTALGTAKLLSHIPPTCAYSLFILLSDDNEQVSRRLEHT
jgi:hypothetical protein